MPDWDALTRGWVERGLLKAEHRQQVLEELEGQPVAGSELPVGPVITLLVAGATWLLTGALVTALMLLLVQDPGGYLMSAVIGGPGALALVLGGAMLSSPRVQPLARGFLAAAPPLLTMGTLILAFSALESIEPDSALGLLYQLAILPGLGCLVGAFFEDSRSWATTSALSAALAGLVALQMGPWSELLSLLAGIVSLLAVGALSALARMMPGRAATLQVAIPSLVLYLGVALSMSMMLMGPLWKALGTDWGWGVEKSLLVLLAAVVLVGFGAFSRSPFTLVPALLLVGAATVALAGAVGSWIGGTLALGAVGGLFLAGAATLWVTRGTGLRGSGVQAEGPGGTR
jgi:hypothetical protein